MPHMPIHGLINGLAGLRRAAPVLAIAAALGCAGPALAQDTAPAAGTTAPAATAPAAAPANPPAPIVEQGALDLLKKVTTQLADAKALEFSVRDLRDVPTDQGQTMTLVGEADVLLQRPDKLMVDSSSDGAPGTLFLFDGTKLSVYDAAKNVIATADITGTVDDLIKAAAERHGLHFAFADFLFANPYSVLADKLTHAYEAPLTQIDGTDTRHLVFAAPGIEWQLWVDAESELPRLFVVTYVDTPQRPRFVVDFLSWNLAPEIDADTFAFTPADDAVAIEFLPNDAK